MRQRPGLGSGTVCPPSSSQGSPEQPGGEAGELAL